MRLPETPDAIERKYPPVQQPSGYEGLRSLAVVFAVSATLVVLAIFHFTK